MPPGWTETAPMLRPASGWPAREDWLSVTGVKETLEDEEAAFWLFQTPPPVVPR